VYIDGIKIARVYGSWHHISSIEPGVHEIQVTLNANSHEEYAFNGEVISILKTITIK